MSYTMEYAEARKPGDEVVEDKGVTVLVDPKAVLFLLGTEMDFETTKLSSQFVFNNPNQTSACGCGESRRDHAGQPERARAHRLSAGAGAVASALRRPRRASSPRVASSTVRLRPSRLAANMHRSARSSSETGGVAAAVAWRRRARS